MAQAGCVMMLSGVENPESKVPFFAGIDRCKFRRPVVPGDQLRLELEALRQRGVSCKLQGRALVGEELAAEATVYNVTLNPGDSIYIPPVWPATVLRNT